MNIFYILGSKNDAFSAERQIKKWTHKKKEALNKVSFYANYAKKIFQKVDVSFDTIFRFTQNHSG